MIQVRVRETGQVPRKNFDSDCVHTLYASQDIELGVGAVYDMPLKIKVQIPAKHIGLVMSHPQNKAAGLYILPGMYNPGDGEEMVATILVKNSSPVKIENGSPIARLAIVQASNEACYLHFKEE